ncbi:MAG: aminotransferase class V-fold PLP-dependent enzyme [Desulfurococcales archaeon]|nr:aminotransferase class V-fold PLP-dependent enzyme [Desulfurococcales archaeon]
MLSVYTRGDFPGLGSFQSYLNTAVVGLVPRTVRDKGLRSLLEFINNPLGKSQEAIDVYNRIRTVFSTLIGLGNKDNIVITNGTTDCIVSIAASLIINHYRDHREPVIIGVTKQEFPGVVYALRSLCESLNAYCNKVVEVGGSVEWEEEASAFLDRKGRLLVASSIQWTTGYKGDLGDILKSRRDDSYIILDTAQHFGQSSVPIYMRHADAACGTSIKWLLMPVASLGIAYINDRLIEEIAPVVYGLSNLEIDNIEKYYIDPGKNPLHDNLLLKRDATRFLPVGKPSIHAMELFLESLNYLVSISPMAVEDHIMGLRKILVEMLEDINLREHLEGYSYRSKSGIILVETGLKTLKEVELVKRLMSRGIAVSARGQSGIHGIRVSIHLYNNEKDLYKFVDELKIFLRSSL